MSVGNKTIIGGGLGIVGLWLAAFAGWLTHVIVCIQASNWVLLIIGAIFAPIGIVHGIGQWFGLW